MFVSPGFAVQVPRLPFLTDAHLTFRQHHGNAPRMDMHIDPILQTQLVDPPAPATSGMPDTATGALVPGESTAVSLISAFISQLPPSTGPSADLNTPGRQPGSGHVA